MSLPHSSLPRTPNAAPAEALPTMPPGRAAETRFDTTYGSLEQIGRMRRELPLTGEIYPVGVEDGSRPLPDADAVNAFGARHLRPIGATTMQAREIPGSTFPAELLVDCYADNVFPLPDDREVRAHDLSDHAMGAITFPEVTTRIFGQVAGVARALRLADPGTARELTVAVAHVFDYRSSVAVRFLRGVRDYAEEPLLLTHLNSFLKGADLRRMADETKRASLAAKLAMYKDAIELAIDDVPDAERSLYAAGTKIERWAEWEANNMPAYAANVRRVLSRQPRTRLLRSIAAALGMRVGS